MKIITLTHLLIYTFFNIIYAQNSIKGKVVDDNKKALAFANIGIPNAGIGTISNDDGTFELNVAPGNLNDSLLISLVGYLNRKVCIKDAINKDIDISLSVSIQMLQPVTVTSRQREFESYILGNSNANGGIIDFGAVYSGAQHALLIDIKKVRKK